MNNLLVYFDVVGSFGGAQQSTCTLLNYLDRNRCLGIEPVVFVVPGTDSRFLAALKCRMHVLKNPPKGNIFSLSKRSLFYFQFALFAANRITSLLSKEYQKRKVILMCNSPKALHILFLVRFLKNDSKLIYYCRGSGEKSHFGLSTRLLLSYVVDHVVCVSSITSTNIRKFLPERKRVTVAFTSVELPDPASPAYALKPLVDSARLKILFAGALIPAKGLHVLLEAISLIPDGLQNKLEVLIAGALDTPGSRAYVERCKKIARTATSPVSWLGWIDDMPQTISKVDVVCLLSFSEGLPRVIQEGMYYEKIVIATPVGGVTDLILHNETGLLAEIGDPSSLANMLGRVLLGDVSSEMTSRAKERFEQIFAIDKQARMFAKQVAYEN